jgi:ribonuclease G
MSFEILISATPRETRVALTEQGLLQEIYIERKNKVGPVGNIYYGKVMRVMPGMQAAFVDIGLDKAGFIHAADAMPVNIEPNTPIPDIVNLLRDGQLVVVQVVKEPIGSKGARLTMQLSIAGRYLVFMPGNRHLGISQRIEQETERERLLGLLDQAVNICESDQQNSTPELRGGFILRTAAEGATLEELLNDIRFLYKLWASVERRQQESGSNKVRLLYQDLVLYMRAMRDILRANVERIRVDDSEIFAEARGFLQDFTPELLPMLELYQEERPLFDVYSIEEEIQKALARTVHLKSGGNLVIDQNEAMTTIDINTGAFIGNRNQEETIFRTNLEAAKSIARQLKVRNIGGIVIIDFIDMHNEEHKRQVLRALTAALEKDPARTRVTGLSELGLIEMTRKRTRESLQQILCQECPECQGRARIKTPETMCYEIFREILRVASAYENQAIRVLCAQDVVDRMLDEESSTIANLEMVSGKKINFQIDGSYGTEQFDIVLF